jgi:hypothetical protein
MERLTALTEQDINVNTTDDRFPFSSYLIDIDKGRVEDDATRLVAEAVLAVEMTGKAAKVIVMLTIAPVDIETFDENPALWVEGEAKAVLPRLRRSPAMFWATGVDGQMTRTDPNRDDPRDR